VGHTISTLSATVEEKLIPAVSALKMRLWTLPPLETHLGDTDPETSVSHMGVCCGPLGVRWRITGSTCLKTRREKESAKKIQPRQKHQHVVGYVM